MIDYKQAFFGLLLLVLAGLVGVLGARQYYLDRWQSERLFYIDRFLVQQVTLAQRQQQQQQQQSGGASARPVEPAQSARPDGE